MLEWEYVDKDIVAQHEDHVFRLRKETKIIKITQPYHDKITCEIFKIQLRKKQNIKFEDLGYEFLLEEGDYIYINKRDFVDCDVWSNHNEIVDRLEQILLALGFIQTTAPKIKNTSSPDILRAASYGIIRALKENQFLETIPEYNMYFLEDMFLRLLSYWEISHNPNEYMAKDKSESEIKLKELEIEIKFLMSKPDLYFNSNWKEVWDSQKHLHDEDWIIMEKEVEKEEDLFLEIEKNERKGTWTESKISRRIEEGHGQGEKDGYKSWLTSDGLPENFKESSLFGRGWTLNRGIRRLGELDQGYFNVIDWESNYIDLREYFPLNRERTLQIAKELKITHIKDKSTKTPIVMTVNFLITYLENGVEKQKAIITGWSDKVNSKRFKNQMKIQEIYWNEKGVEVQLITEKDINWTLAKNYYRLSHDKYASHYIISEESCKNTINTLEKYKQTYPNVSLTEFAKLASVEEAEENPGTILFYLQFLITNNVIEFPIEDIPFEYHNPISLLDIKTKCFTIEVIHEVPSVFPDNVLTITNY
ncbi:MULTISPECIES: TnsA endonuclease N-terminal domain-containing protein [Metabacillus]|uniref:TnsA endonuclease N-terminal domain-containing protein n=2 Tax=Bacillaceae TaxID=186817 RepID=UPI000C808597|nr:MULTISPECIES: TnsA endonuclease N-terminal domain-containing protein [Metabacillus]MCM3443278.1 TnsA endonuclease N-terminal domain-containing protein [Metabacillus halosaccharovorans]PMC34209.1 hypothetical protein CJ195_24120 [Bacillus sp. UMB0899]